jgi:hypothetical protein
LECNRNYEPAILDLFRPFEIVRSRSQFFFASDLAADFILILLTKAVNCLMGPIQGWSGTADSG